MKPIVTQIQHAALPAALGIAVIVAAPGATAGPAQGPLAKFEQTGDVATWTPRPNWENQFEAIELTLCAKDPAGPEEPPICSDPVAIGDGLSSDPLDEGVYKYELVGIWRTEFPLGKGSKPENGDDENGRAAAHAPPRPETKAILQAGQFTVGVDPSLVEPPTPSAQ